MGSVKIDVKKGEREWENVNEATVESIKGLIKYRYRLDPTYSFSDEVLKVIDDVEYQINYEAIHTYVVLDSHIKKARLTDSQKEVLKLYESGMTESDIADYLNKKQNAIYSMIKTICKKIHKEAVEEWLDYINLDVIPTKYEYKQCVSCGDWKPKDVKFFSPNSDSSDGYRNFCRKCR